MILENNRKHDPKPTDFNCCVQLSVNIESTNRAGFYGFAGKIAARKANSLATGWKTKRATNPRQRMIALSTNESDLRYAY